MNKISEVKDTKRSYWAALLIGIGVMAGIDEIVFHQILQWHHFFDLSTPTIGILADGLLHAAELIIIVAGIFIIADLNRDKAFSAEWAWPGFFIGAGGFQLFDGIIDHKVLRIHQIRYDVENLFIYDLSWNLGAVILILIGVWLYRKAPSAPSGTGTQAAN